VCGVVGVGAPRATRCLPRDALELSFELPVAAPGFGQLARKLVQGAPKAPPLFGQHVVDARSVVPRG
jgi:hypothetical protein